MVPDCDFSAFQAPGTLNGRVVYTRGGWELSLSPSPPYLKSTSWFPYMSSFFFFPHTGILILEIKPSKMSLQPSTTETALAYFTDKKNPGGCRGHSLIHKCAPSAKHVPRQSGYRAGLGCKSENKNHVPTMASLCRRVYSSTNAFVLTPAGTTLYSVCVALVYTAVRVMDTLCYGNFQTYTQVAGTRKTPRIPSILPQH